jgi:hypothetical protein
MSIEIRIPDCQVANPAKGPTFREILEGSFGEITPELRSALRRKVVAPIPLRFLVSLLKG